MKRSQAKFTLVTVSDSTLISSSWTGFSEQRFVEARQSWIALHGCFHFCSCFRHWWWFRYHFGANVTLSLWRWNATLVIRNGKKGELSIPMTHQLLCTELVAGRLASCARYLTATLLSDSPWATGNLCRWRILQLVAPTREHSRARECIAEGNFLEPVDIF